MPNRLKVGFFEGKFLPLHKGHIECIDQASKQVDKLYVILSFNRKRDAERCKQYNQKEISPEIRLSWLAYVCKKYPNIELTSIEDFDDEYDFLKMRDKHDEIFKGKLTHVFSSEPSYDKYFKILYPNCKHVIIDETRNIVGISAHEILENPFKHWEYIPKHIQPFFVKKILITGIESVGKSTMCENLAKYFHTNYVDETARPYCEEFNNFLHQEQFIEFAIKHFVRQQEALKDSNKYLFVDGDAQVTLYYLMKYFPNNSWQKATIIKELINYQNYDQIFYLNSDVPWIQDGYRFLESTRKEDDKFLLSVYTIDYKNILHEIKGSDYNKRFNDIVFELVNFSKL